MLCVESFGSFESFANPAVSGVRFALAPLAKLVERGGFEPPKEYSSRFTVCSVWPLRYLSNSAILWRNPFGLRSERERPSRTFPPAPENPKRSDVHRERETRYFFFSRDVVASATIPSRIFCWSAFLTPPTFGAGEGTRTLNLRITNPLLYQLSYASPSGGRSMIADRNPPATLREAARCVSRNDRRRHDEISQLDLRIPPGVFLA